MTLTPLDQYIQYQSGKSKNWLFKDRQAYYDLVWAYLMNYVFETLQNGGYKEVIATHYGRSTSNLLAGIYNPVKRVINLYNHVFGGMFGDKIQVIPTNDNDVILDPIKNIWKWTNINIEKQMMTTNAALFGTLGIRIAARNVPSKRIYMKFEKPDRIKNIVYDDRGNVERVTIEYERDESINTSFSDFHTIREELAKDVFRTYRDDIPYDLINNINHGPLSMYENRLGVTPYVILQHRNVGLDWGSSAIAGEETKIDLLNMLMGHIFTQIARHIQVKWAITASGNAPKEIDLGETSAIYMKTDPSTNLAPTMQPLIANLSLGDALATANNILDELRDSLPELKATDGKFLSGQSGESIIQLRQPSEQLILEARTNYEDAMIRAQQIALSWGIILGAWDLGTGTGTKQAADAAYESGLEDHIFNAREALPLTSYQAAYLETQTATARKTRAETANILDQLGAVSPRQKLVLVYPEWQDDDIDRELEAIQASAIPNPETLAPDDGQMLGEDTPDLAE